MCILLTSITAKHLAGIDLSSSRIDSIAESSTVRRVKRVDDPEERREGGTLFVQGRQGRLYERC